MKVLLTGASGFVGKCIFERISQHYEVVGLGRRMPNNWPGDFIEIPLESLATKSIDLTKVDTVIHAAARTHVMSDNIHHLLAEYRRTNTLGTVELAKQAAEQGVKRFIFISTIKVNGESTYRGGSFLFNDKRNPEDEYAQSKAEAEILLEELANKTEMEVVIIRPPLIYGPGVKANFSSLMRLVNTGIPLPFASLDCNERSLVSVDNLVDLITTCVHHPKAGNQIFLVSDDNDLSTSNMIKLIAQSLGKNVVQIPFPILIYKVLGKFFGRSSSVDRLINSLKLDITHTKETLNWRPPQTPCEGFKKTASAYLRQINRE